LRKAFLLLASLVIVALLAVNYFVIQTPKGNTDTNIVKEPEIPEAMAASENSVSSPDGTKTLVMKVVKGKTQTDYSIFTGGIEIFKKTVDNSIAYSVPANTWSPDNKYVFLKETGSAGTKFFALSPIVDYTQQDDKTANITDIFATKYPGMIITDATGWGGVNLIVFNTLKEDGGKGNSFWFEMPSQAVIQLANRFN